MAKILFVSSSVQAALMTQVFIPELIDGFWKNHRPAGHGEVWKDVDVQVTVDGTLGPVGFDAPRNYNFLNLDFALPNEARLVAVAQGAKASSNFKSVKKELIELGRIVGSRLASRDANPLKLFRGNHKPGTQTVSSARARAAANAMGSAGTQALGLVSVQAPSAIVVTPEVAGARKMTGPKRTVTKVKSTLPARSPEQVAATKAKLAELHETVTTTSQGATVRRVPAVIEASTPAAE
jgi:hypothetical protein